MNPTLSRIMKHQLKQVSLTEMPKLSQKFQHVVEKDLNGTIHLFGSAVTGLSLKERCDLDICIEMDTEDEEESLKVLYRMLKFHKMKEMSAILRARVPIVKFFDPYSNVKCDVNINKPLGVLNSKLLKAYVDLDERVGELCVFVKYWAKMNHIHGAFDRFLSSYAWNLLVIHFLQRRGVIPDLQDIKSHSFMKRSLIKKRDVDGWDCSFFDRVDLIPQTNNHTDLGGLLIDFFEYYVYGFDFDENFISFGEKSSLGVVHRRETSALVVIDPFELNHNVARSLNSENLEKIIWNMKGTLKKLEKRKFQ